MNGDEFIRRIRRLGRITGVAVEIDAARGKGSHKTIWYGERFTVVKHSEIGRGLLHKMLKDLGLHADDIQ